MNSAKKTTRQKLALAYQILAFLKLDDHTYTHLSARAEDGHSFYIYPFGLRFEEVTPECLMRVSFDGKVLEGEEYQYNQTGYVIHGAIYQKRSDIQAVFHLHTPATVAVSAIEGGLLPLSQWALHFYGQVAYHEYDSLAIAAEQGKRLTDDLGERPVMLLRHHGSVTTGRTIPEALFYTYHLEQACQTQCLMLGMQQPVIPIPVERCEKAVRDLLSFEKNLGERDWLAWERMIERLHEKKRT